ncbi:MAG: hypothetical protein M1822_002682 [Bathelium mastoideum]|nr:MAG: hypothetical protein M1822_002682 [Bathelium mastoideum]
MDNLDFLGGWPMGSASLTITLPDGVVSTIDGINLDKIQERCPLLAMAFEPGPHGPKYSMEVASLPVVASFLRFLYLGDYHPPDQWGSPEEYPLLLLHAQLFQLGKNYDVPQLCAETRLGINTGIEESLSYPVPPPGLCEAIRFLYNKLPDQRNLINDILHYCVSGFAQHKLGTNAEFRRLAYELAPFHKDLVKMNHEHGFQDEGAMDIVQLPSGKTEPRHEDFSDVVYEFFGNWHRDGQTNPNTESKQPTGMGTFSNERPFTLVLRPTNPNLNVAAPRSSDPRDPSTEVEDFTMILRPKQKQNPTGSESELEPQSKRLRLFDPSTPCGPASPHPQKIVRGFEPLKQQPTPVLRLRKSSIDNTVVGQSDIKGEPAASDESQHRPHPQGSSTGFGTMSSTQNFGWNSYRAPYESNSPLLKEDWTFDSSPPPCRPPTFRPVSSSPSGSRLPFAERSFMPRSAALRRTIETSSAQPTTDTHTITAQDDVQQLEGELRGNAEQHEDAGLAHQPLNFEEGLVNIHKDEEKADDSNESDSDSEWLVV